VRKKYQRKERKSNHKFEVVGGQESDYRTHPITSANVQSGMPRDFRTNSEPNRNLL
jgi:hypothetical protein